MTKEEAAAYLSLIPGGNGGREAETVYRYGVEGSVTVSTFRPCDAARILRRNPAAVLSLHMRADTSSDEASEITIRLDRSMVRGIEMLIRPEKGEPMSEEDRATFQARFAKE